MGSSPKIEGLREHLKALEADGHPVDDARFDLGLEAADRHLGGLATHGLHEVYAATTPDATAALGFALGLMRRAGSDRPVVWGVQAMAGLEVFFRRWLAELAGGGRGGPVLRGRWGGAVDGLGRQQGAEPDRHAPPVDGGGARTGDGRPDATGGPAPAQRSRDPVAGQGGVVKGAGGGGSRPSDLCGRTVAASAGRSAEDLDHGVES